jgi:hypothetical protein
VRTQGSRTPAKIVKLIAIGLHHLMSQINISRLEQFRALLIKQRSL